MWYMWGFSFAIDILDMVSYEFLNHDRKDHDASVYVVDVLFPSDNKMVAYIWLGLFAVYEYVFLSSSLFGMRSMFGSWVLLTFSVIGVRHLVDGIRC